MINRSLKAFKRFVYNMFPPPEVDAFCRLNARRVEEFNNKMDSMSEEGTILVDTLGDHPLLLMKYCLVSNALKAAKGLRVVAMTRHYFNRKLSKVVASYGIAETVNITVLRYPILLISSLFEALPLFIRLNPLELLEMRYKGLHIGDLLYDTYLRGAGLGTVTQKDWFLYRKMAEAVFWHKLYDDMIPRLKIRYIVISHTVYSQYGILLRLALKYNATVYCVQGVFEVPIRKYSRPEDVLNFEIRVPPEIFEETWSNHRRIALEVADNYLKERVSGKSLDDDSRSAYDPQKKIYSKEELIENLGLTPGNPVVFIMSHVFSDAPHAMKPYLFKDHVDWLSQTMQKIEDITDINWVVKEHPANFDPFYFSKSSARQIMDKELGPNWPAHISYVSNNINTNTILRCADGVISGVGNIGIEASAFGIKSLMAGNAAYSGLGFTFDPKTRDEYFSYLKNLFKSNNTSIVDAEKARVAVFLRFKHILVRIGVIPEGRGYKLVMISDEETQAYRDASEVLESTAIYEDYGINRIIDYFKNNEVQLANTFDIYE